MVRVDTPTDEVERMKRLVKKLSNLDVLVGVPQNKSSRPKGEITNAELVYIHTHGSPVNRIPARPIIEPAIEDNENKQIISESLKEAARAVLNGDEQKTTEMLNKAGLDAQNIVRDWFTNYKNNWAPNSPITIRLKGSSKPLIDTAELRKSIIYVIRRKKSGGTS